MKNQGRSTLLLVVLASFLLLLTAGCGSQEQEKSSGGYVETAPNAAPAKKGGKPGVSANQ